MEVSERKDAETEKDRLEKKLVLLGRDVGTIPCFRNSFLYGITSGIMIGIASFAFTSKIRKSTTIGFYSYVGVTFAYWVQCRWDYSTTKFKYTQLQHALKMQGLYEGTDKDIRKMSVTDDDDDS